MGAMCAKEATKDVDTLQVQLLESPNLLQFQQSAIFSDVAAGHRALR
jgi:hypothetical protein